MYNQLGELVKKELDKFLNKPLTESLKENIKQSTYHFIYNYIADESISKYIKFDIYTDDYGNVSLNPANIFTLGVLKGKIFLNLTDRTEGEFRIQGVTYGLKIVNGKPETYFIPPIALEKIKIESTISLD
jgi:hypothetical protein